MSLRAPPEERDVAELLAFGVVALDKPAGPSSHQVSGWLREAVGDALADRGHPRIDRAAHAGTLDPAVTGCLPVLLGDATRLARVFHREPKGYVAVLECHGPVPADLEAVCARFEGRIHQTPPRKSAVARERRVRTIHELTVLEVADRRALLWIRCESGTYVRKLCHDLGLALGTGAHMGDLRRTRSGPFDDTDLASTADVTDALAFWLEDGATDALRSVVAPAEAALASLSTVTIAASAAREVAEGAPVYVPGVLAVDDGAEAGDLVACVTPGGAAVCLGTYRGVAGDAGVAVDLERVLV